ncbi:unnamed protein product, partial [Candidula unifasciata]
MAAINDASNSDNTEMEIDTNFWTDTNVSSLDLSDFISRCVFPQCVCVTEGNFLSRDVQINPGDVLVLKSCNKGRVFLSYRDENSRKWTEVSVDLDYPQKFNVLPPKDMTAESRTASVVMYPTISDLILDCPTYFEATVSYDDPDLPEMSVIRGDQFWFVGMTQYPEAGVERLKVRDGHGNFRYLSLDCRGNFYHLKDDNEYTVKELLELAAVPRRLKMVTTCINTGRTNDETKNIIENEVVKDEYSVVNKILPRPRELFSSASSQSPPTDPLPQSYSGIVYLLKYESTLTVSPYDDLAVTWQIPVSANLKIRSYSQNDYEVPASWKPTYLKRVQLPLSPNEDLPSFHAPIVPQQPLVPLNISNFVEIYCSTFPVRAKIVDTSGAHKFFQEMLKGIDEVNVYRLEETKRLYVKDAKRDDVYSLSHDVTLSFVEYPEKFRTVSDLLHLPVGTEVTVLEDIAADFPKPFSLRFGDNIRVLSNTPYFVKMKHANRDCQVLKCERIDPDGGQNRKLKLPMDFEVNMVITTDSNSRRMLSLQDLLSGAVPLPTRTVASVIDESQNTDLKELPVDLRILRSMKETCIVAASATSKQFPSKLIPKASQISKSASLGKEKAALSCSPQEPALPTNIGLPVSSGIVLAFKDRVELAELDVVESEADYIRLPLEKMTMSQFEERERLRKLNSDYEDIEFGSSSTIDECGSGSGSIRRSGSLGVIDRKQKSTKMDKVLRFSRALNPKHWRHSKAEPEPLPHPSAMGLMALAAREKDDVFNDYHQARMDSVSSKCESVKDGYSASGVSTASSDG